MAILLGASPPPAQTYPDLITGDDADFESSVGAWTVAGGSLTWDSGYTYGGVATGSAKFTSTAQNQYTQLDIVRRFKAGHEYVVFIALSLEEQPSDVSLGLKWGNIAASDMYESDIGGLDTTVRPVPWAPGDQSWWVFALRWTPTADRTSAQIRVTRFDIETGTQNWHIGWAKAFEVARPGEVAGARPPAWFLTSDSVHFAPSHTSGIHYFAGARNAGFYTGPVSMGFDYPYAGIGASLNGGVFMWGEGEGATGDLIAKGWNADVGPDYVGLQMAEYDSNTVQLFADTSGGYFMQLRHRGSGKGWSVTDDPTINRRIESFFEYRVTVAGVLTTGTDKGGVGQVIQLPFKARIDEVRIHAGTAPTGSTLIVDVNASGTTIFTTQGNRPAIAISGTDDTSGVPDGGTSIAKDVPITVDIDQVGSTIPGSDLTVLIRGTAIW